MNNKNYTGFWKVEPTHTETKPVCTSTKAKPAVKPAVKLMVKSMDAKPTKVTTSMKIDANNKTVIKISVYIK